MRFGGFLAVYKTVADAPLTRRRAEDRATRNRLFLDATLKIADVPAVDPER